MPGAAFGAYAADWTFVYAQEVASWVYDAERSYIYVLKLCFSTYAVVYAQEVASCVYDVKRTFIYVQELGFCAYDIPLYG